MRHIIIGAAGLLLSTTALAAVNDSKSAEALGESMIHNATLIDWPAKRAAAQPASDNKAFVAGETKPIAEPATAEIPSTAAMTDSVDAEPIESESKSIESEPVAADTMDGMGGPDETEAAAVATAAPATSYRPCAPGPGDDNCIQLYEPGVSEAYAAWQAGNAPGAAQTAMGGPEEETAFVEPASAETGELAAYDEPLPEDLVLPGEEGNLESASAATDSTMAI